MTIAIDDRGTPVTLTVDAIVYDDGLYYPAGVAGDPIPGTCIRAVEHKRCFKHGDIVVDTYGQAWNITTAGVLAALEPPLAFPVQGGGGGRYVDDLEGPFVLIYREGEPRDELML